MYGELSGGLFLISRLLFYAVDESNTRDDIYQQIVTPQSEPFFLSCFYKLERHSQCCCPDAAIFGLGCSQSDSSKYRFNRVSRSDVLPVLGRIIVESQHGIFIFSQAFHGFWIFRIETRYTVSKCFISFFTCFCCQILCNAPLTLGCMALGSFSNTLAVLCTQQRC